MQKRREMLEYMTPDGKKICFPVATIEGAHPGPVFVITAGIHGAEYPGIASAIQIFRELEPEQVHGTLIIVTISSVEAFERRSMFVCPWDGKNPNRCFPGKKDGTYTKRMVNLLFEEIISKADYHLDLHGGDMVENLDPFSLYHIGNNEEVTQKSREMAVYYGLANLISTSSSGTWPDVGANYANSAEHGIPAIITEVGKIGQMEKQDVEIHLRGIRNVLKYAGVLEGEPEKFEDIVEYRNFVWLYTPVKGIFYCDVKIAQEIKKDQVVGHMEDYFGTFLMDIQAPVDGKILFLTTSPAMQRDGLIMGIGEI